MTELEFGERLKRYRTRKGLTQQELADRLGVSNKSVSRWETGGYPDIATLGPLARALGVTVDDLLNEQAPIRTLGAYDWQSLLSFAFAVGGGVLFFLLNLFTPAPVCYLLYLCSMAYGVYLQRHYTCHSRWFYLANAAMNFFVNLTLTARLAAALGVPLFFSHTGQLLTFMSSDRSLLLFPLLILAAAAAVTGLTQWIILCRPAGSPLPLRLRLRRAPMTPRKAVPPVFLLLLTLYLYLFALPGPLPAVLYLQQGRIYLTLVLFFSLCCLLLFGRKGRRGMLAPSLLLMGLAATLPGLCIYPRAYSQQFHSIVADTGNLAPHLYSLFAQPSTALPIAAVLMAVGYLILCHVHITSEVPSEKA